jgi:hypothetical protein
MSTTVGALRVYGWQDHRAGVGQVRAIVAARSKTAAARCAGKTAARQLFNLEETGNAVECEVALARPGVVYWVSLRGSDWYRASSDAALWRTDA